MKKELDKATVKENEIEKRHAEKAGGEMQIENDGCVLTEQPESRVDAMKNASFMPSPKNGKKPKTKSISEATVNTMPTA